MFYVHSFDLGQRSFGKDFIPVMPTEKTFNIEQLIEEYKHSNATLGFIFDADPALYRNVTISEIGLDSNVLSRVRRIYRGEDFPLSRLLCFNIDTMEKTRNLGIKGIIHILKTLDMFFKKFEVRYSPVEPLYDGDINIYRLDRSLRLLMSGESTDKIHYRNDEIKYVEHYKEAVTLLDEFICERAYKNDEFIVALMESNFRFSYSIETSLKYQENIEHVFFSLPAYIRNKPAINFVKSYFLKHELWHKETLMNLSIGRTLSDMIKLIRKEHSMPYSLYVVLIDFCKWLNFDEV